jgi:hypothetical protein
MDAAQVAPSSLFGWRGGGVVLLGDYADDRWTIARGWLGADGLTDVRRWTFAAPSAFAGQVRRLVLEATDDAALARARGAEALVWATAVADHPPT